MHIHKYILCAPFYVYVVCVLFLKNSYTHTYAHGKVRDGKDL